MANEDHDVARWLRRGGVDGEASVEIVSDDYVPLALETGHRVAGAVHAIALRRPDGKGVLDIRLDRATGQLISATLALYAAPEADVPLLLDGASALGSGVPVFDVPPPGTADSLAVSGHGGADVPLTLHRGADSLELAWSNRRVDGVVSCGAVRFLFGGTEWIGVAVSTG